MLAQGYDINLKKCVLTYVIIYLNFNYLCIKSVYYLILIIQFIKNVNLFSDKVHLANYLKKIARPC